MLLASPTMPISLYPIPFVWSGGIAAALVVICLVCTGNEDFKPYEESDSNRTALLNGLRDESLRDSNMSHGKEEMP